MAFMDIGKTKFEDRRDEKRVIDHRSAKEKKILLAYWNPFTINEIAEKSK